MSDYGKRGGTSVNAGRTATTYAVPLPDGRTVTKKSYQISTDEAYCGIYQHEGTWYVSGIVSEPQQWGSQQFIRVKRA